MQIFSLHSGANWIATKPAQDGLQDGEKEERDPEKDEIKRVLSVCFRCNNLSKGPDYAQYWNTPE